MIYFRGANTSEGIKELLLSGFTADNGLNYSRLISFKATFSDAECTIIQCKHEARRSFLDLYEICKTYFPDCTQKEVAQAISSIENIFCNRCADIKKYVFFIYLNGDGGGCFNKETRDPYNPINLSTVDDFSFEDFEKLLD